MENKEMQYQQRKRTQWKAAYSLFAILVVAGIAGCSGGTPSFLGRASISPGTATLGLGEQQSFYAEVSLVPVDSRSGVYLDGISWKVKEGDAGGTIAVVPGAGASADRTAIYTAPQTQGVYHVQVTAHYSNGPKTDTVSVEVR